MKNDFEYWYIEENSFGDFDNDKSKALQANGPFYSMRDIRNHVIESCEDRSRVKIAKIEFMAEVVSDIKMGTELVEIGE